MILSFILNAFLVIVIIDAVFRLDKNERCKWLRRHDWNGHHGVEDICKHCGKFRLNFGYALSDVYSESIAKKKEELK